MSRFRANRYIRSILSWLNEQPRHKLLHKSFLLFYKLDFSFDNFFEKVLLSRFSDQPRQKALQALISTSKPLNRTYCLGFAQNQGSMSCQQLTSSKTECSKSILSTFIALVLSEPMS